MLIPYPCSGGFKLVFTKFIKGKTWGYDLGIMNNRVYQYIESVCLKRFVLKINKNHLNWNDWCY